MKLRLDSAIEDLYVAFDEAPRPSRPEQLDICPCCVSSDEIRALLAADRRSLSDHDLNPYIHTARGPVTGADFLYFFPRIAELMFLEDRPIEWVPVFKRLGSVDSQSWKPRQRLGVVQLMSSLIAAVGRLSEEAPEIVSDGWLIDDVVCCLGRSGLDMKPHLASLLNYPRLCAAYYARNGGAENSGHLKNAFWGNDSAEAQAQVVSWLQSQPVLAVLTEP